MYCHVIFLDNKPSDIYIVLKSENSRDVYYHALNDQNCLKISEESVLMWLNIDKARKFCRKGPLKPLTIKYAG